MTLPELAEALQSGALKLVPGEALDWLFGEGTDPAGLHFGEFPDDHPQPAGKFWWRKTFRQMLSPAPDQTDVVEAIREAVERFDVAAHLERQREWSRTTFGPGPRTKGVLDHIRKELNEIEADPTDITEWVDVIILAFDGAWRAGWEPADIIAAWRAKQSKNEARQWPDWRTAEPDKAIEHVREEPR